MTNFIGVSARLPAQDLERARAFYSDKLGLTPVEERPGGLRYQCGSGSFAIFTTRGAPSGTHTQLALEVEDLESTMAELRARGVVFQDYDFPGMKTQNGLTEVEGNYPSRGGVGERACWFYDSEGNLIGVGQAMTKR
jgi:catechol 2,3-dioxygenase-like lactoylglutathione lyase family enzyme